MPRYEDEPIDDYPSSMLTNFELRYLPAMKAAVEKHPECNLEIRNWAYTRLGERLDGYNSLHVKDGLPARDCSEFWKTYDKERRQLGLYYNGEVNNVKRN